MRYHAGFGDQLVSFGQAPTVGEALVGTDQRAAARVAAEEAVAAAAVPVGRAVPHAGAAEPQGRRPGPAPQQRKVRSTPEGALPKELKKP